MNQSKISYEQILSLSEQLKSASQNVEQILGNVTSLFNRIGDSGVWSGQTAQTARTQFDTLAKKFPEFVDAISKCQTYLASVVENYKNIDTNILNG